MSGTLSNVNPALVSGYLEPTVPAYPTTVQVALAILGLMGAQSGILTDFNIGSVIRTASESIGSVVELQGLAEQTLAFQTIVYGAMAALGIRPIGANAATGIVTFTAPGPAVQAVSIPGGTLLQTTGGVQFQTTSGVVLASGSSNVNAGVVAVSGGTTGNIAASGIVQILSGLGYPLTVLNGSATAGGANAETLGGTLARFAAAVAAPGLASPVAVPNKAIGVSAGSEKVQYAACYEPWVAAGTGVGSGTAGFTLYIDNGTGAASSGLIAAVQAAISGTPGFRPVGVPYYVLSTAPTYTNITVSGSLLAAYAAASASITSGITDAIDSYVGSLPISGTLYLGNLTATVGSAGEGQLASFSVSISGAPGSGLTSISAPYSGRIIINTLTVQVS
jgi:uncharacterized phage protein gp47/JayE